MVSARASPAPRSVRSVPGATYNTQHAMLTQREAARRRGGRCQIFDAVVGDQVRAHQLARQHAADLCDVRGRAGMRAGAARVCVRAGVHARASACESTRAHTCACECACAHVGIECAHEHAMCVHIGVRACYSLR